MSESGATKDKPSEPDKPEPLEMVVVDHDYVEYSQTGGTTMVNEPKDK